MCTYKITEKPNYKEKQQFSFLVWNTVGSLGMKLAVSCPAFLMSCPIPGFSKLVSPMAECNLRVSPLSSEHSIIVT